MNVELTEHPEEAAAFTYAINELGPMYPRNIEKCDGYIIRDENDIVGAALIEPKRQSETEGGLVSWLHRIAISEDARGNGYGGALLDHLCGLYKTIELEVDNRKERAIELYKSRTFEITAEKHTVFHDGTEGKILVMRYE